MMTGTTRFRKGIRCPGKQFQFRSGYPTLWDLTAAPDFNEFYHLCTIRRDIPARIA
jgi:hypothetical protein